MNGFSHRTESDLDMTAAAAAGQLATATGFPVTPAQKAALGQASADYHRLLGAAREAADAARAATLAKDAARDSVLAALSSISSSLYPVDSGVTDAMLREIGFAPRRSGSSRPKPPQRVTGLRAVPDALGGVRLSWARGANSETTVFQVEASTGGAWTMVGSGLRISLKLSGFAPGTPTWFRVVATTASLAAPPSAAVAIYGPVAEAARLRVA